MISENLAKIFSHLKKDDDIFFINNWDIISLEMQKDFLSYCIEEKAFKVFELAIKKGLTQLRSLIVANAIRSNDEKILDLIKKHNLFDYSSTKSTDLFSISVNNNDLPVIDFLIDKVDISKDILSFALNSHNHLLIQKFIEKEFSWNYEYPENNPIVFVMENYKANKKETMSLISKTKQFEKIKNEALIYFKSSSRLQELKEYLEN